MRRWEETGWQDEDLDKLRLSFLRGFLRCEEPEGVDAAIAFAGYCSKIGIDPDNYPIFLEMLEIKNHWVADAILQDKDPAAFFEVVQPNYFILKKCFKAMAQAKKGGIYLKTLLVYLGIIKFSYQNAQEGYKTYPVTPADINNLGKHLDEEQDQTDS